MKDVLVSTVNMSTADWHKYRNTGIGGSDVSVLCGINKYKSAVELWMEKTGQIKPKEAGEAAYWGTIMEPLIRNEFSKRTNLKVKLVKAILKHPNHSFMLANVDGVIKDPIYGECIFEAKTASVFKQNDWEDDKIPEEYMLQIQHYMAVTGYNRTFIAVLIGGNQFKFKTIERDDDLIEMIIKLEEDFWKHVLDNTPPELDGSQASSELLSRLYPESNNNHKILLPEEAKDLIIQYELGKEKEKVATEIKDEAVNKLKSLLGDNECGVIEDRQITWKSVSSERFDAKKFQLENSEVYKNYISKSSSRRFSIK
jgi:putative phage-type endonuclease